MTAARFLVGDVFDRMADLPTGSVDLVLTSPPFLALRSYLPADHPDKAKEIGTEPDPAAFLDTLLHLTAEWRRVLAPHGSIAVELGDTYSGSGGAGGDYAEGGWRDGQSKFDGSARRNRGGLNGRASMVEKATGGHHMGGDGWPMAKSLCGIPHLFHLSLAYGRNLLTGAESPAGQWRVRNVIAWCRPNPPVGALSDKFRPATSFMTIACVARDRYFDLDAVRTPGENAATRRVGAKAGASHLTPRERGDVRPGEHPAGAPPLDWWEIPTQPYAGSHYAAWPEALLTRPIEAMCPRRVCVTCGTPSRRLTETQGHGSRVHAVAKDERTDRHDWNAERPVTTTTTTTTSGWTTCGCPGTDGIRLDGYHTGPGWRPGIVLDPFAGSGTTLAVATGHGRDAIGIDLDERNVNLARERVGMFLDVEHPEAVVQP